MWELMITEKGGNACPTYNRVVDRRQCIVLQELIFPACMEFAASLRTECYSDSIDCTFSCPGVY